MALPQDDLSRLITASNNARYAGAGSGGWGTALRYLGAIGAGAAGARDNGIIPAFFNTLGNIGQVKNESTYNQYLRAAADYERKQQQLQNENDAELLRQRTGVSVIGPFDRSFANQSASDIRKSNSVASVNDLLQGRPLQLDQYGDYDPALINNYLKQQGDVANTNYAMDQANALFNQGQGASSIGGRVPSLPTIPGMVQEPAGLDDGSGQLPLQAGASQQVVPPPTVSPFLQPTVTAADIFGQYGAGAKDQQESGQQANVRYGNQSTRSHYERSDSETAKHNRAEESIGRTNAAAHMLSAKKSGSGGGSQNPYTVPNSALENINKQVELAQKNLQAMGLWDKKRNQPVELAPESATIGTGFLGSDFGGHGREANPKYASYLNKQRAIENYINLTNAPFGGQSQANLQAIPSNFNEWKKNRK